TLLFGIPGSGSMAVFIGGMILLGYEAGPQMIRDDLPITYTVVWSLALANVVGAGLCIFLSGGIARLTTIPFPLLTPFLLMMISFAAFQSKQTLWDLVALAAIGLLGILMRRFDWSRPAFLIGFVLADQAEVYTYQSTQIAMLKAKTGGIEGALGYLFSPVGLVLIGIIALSIWLGARQSGALHAAEGEPAAEPEGSTLAPTLFAGAVALFLAISFVDALTVSVLIDMVFPAIVSGFSLLAALILLWRMRARPATDPLFADAERVDRTAEPHGLGATLFWFGLLLGLTALFGFIIALGLFFVVFLTVRARAPIGRTAILTAVGLGFVLLMAGLLNRDFPPGLLQEYMHLPWPFGDA
ncbi:MAG: tripartite tricarboxylate transporter permease, partial [Pseudomonadota bacterium]